MAFPADIVLGRKSSAVNNTFTLIAPDGTGTRRINITDASSTTATPEYLIFRHNESTVNKVRILRHVSSLVKWKLLSNGLIAPARCNVTFEVPVDANVTTANMSDLIDFQRDLFLSDDVRLGTFLLGDQ